MNQNLLKIVGAVIVVCLAGAFFLRSMQPKPVQPPAGPVITVRQIIDADPRKSAAYETCDKAPTNQSIPEDKRAPICECVATNFGHSLTDAEWFVFALPLEAQRRKDPNFVNVQIMSAASRDKAIFTIAQDVKKTTDKLEAEMKQTQTACGG